VRIGLIHPGEMGAAIGGQLVARGHEVLWLPEGRSGATARRAADAGLTGVERFDDEVEVILSVCPPHAAVEVACSLAGTPALFIDANAVSPRTAQSIGELIGERFLDGGIIGPPPSGPGTTRLYLSGEHAEEGAAIFADTTLEAVILDGQPVAASALKMSYAAWTKGSAALLLAARAAARATGVEGALLTEWSRSQPDLEARSRSAADSAASKGWRWKGEMEEIASMFEQAGLPRGFHDAAAEVFDSTPRR
jgi:3-hydroxyisobutyrate dehydrogenase-like beta-hydroxyacid dehydrogenase